MIPELRFNALIVVVLALIVGATSLASVFVARQPTVCICAEVP